MKERLKRNEVPTQQTWDLADLFTSEDQWQQTLDATLREVEAFLTYEGRLCESGKTLLEAIERYADLYEKITKIGTYTSLKQSEDGTNPENQSRSMQFSSAMSTVSANLSFFNSEIQKLSESEYTQLLSSEPGLAPYKCFLDDLMADKKYQLSPETEKVLASLAGFLSAPYRIYGVSKSADMTFESVQDGEGHTLPNSFALFENKYEFSTNTVLRRNAYEAFSKTLKQYSNTYAAVYAAEVGKQVALSRARGHESVFHMLLHDQKIPYDMYRKQIELIYTELAPHMRKYACLKREQLGLDEMRFCDLKAPLDADFAPPATYEEIETVITDALAILGPDYQAIIKRAFSDRWIDYCDNVGKSTGAFCSSPYGVHPYILISYDANMRSAFTLAHELGHAGHFQLAMNAQNIFDLRPSTYFVEAPSTMNEMLLAEHLMAKDDTPRMKRWVILQLMGTYYHNFVTHLLEAEYQRRVYEFAEAGKPLTASLLTATKLDVLRTFWGDAVVIDDDAGLTWMRQPHYYMGLYPYTYSAGLSAATAVAKKIFKEGAPAVEKWLETLKTGGALPPHELLKKAGIDMSTPEPIRDAVQYVGELVDTLVELFE